MKTVVDMIRASIIYTNITKILEDVDTIFIVFRGKVTLKPCDFKNILKSKYSFIIIKAI